jgi:hypothetical protein
MEERGNASSGGDSMRGKKGKMAVKGGIGCKEMGDKMVGWRLSRLARR